MPNSTTTNKISEYYNKYANQYYNARVISGGSLFNDYIEMPAVLDMIPDNLTNIEVLDIGCGLGLYSKVLCERGAKVTAIDISEEMLGYAQESCFGLDVEFVNTSFIDFIVSPNRKFDLIIGGFMLSYFDNLDNVFSKVATILNKNGICIFSMLHPLRLSSCRNSSGKYIIDNYFDSSRLYESDFLNNKDLLYLKKWSISDVTKASSNHNILIDSIQEPLPINLPSFFSVEKTEYLYKCPSVIIYKFINK